jgi:endonuclease/exonuclease/phosphatase family metal-dependent hydrolase
MVRFTWLEFPLGDPMKRIGLSILILALGGCTRLEPDIVGQAGAGSSVGSDTAASPDTVHVATYNLSIGYEVASLIASDLTSDTVAWNQANRILDQYIASRPLGRMRAAAEAIARHCPDLVGLQETENLRVTAGRVDVPVVPFLDSLVAWLARYPGDCARRYALLRSPLNVTTRTLSRADRPDLGVLGLHFEEGNAILYDTTAWTMTDSSTTIFSDLLRTELLGQRMGSERAVQYGRFVHRRPDGRRFTYQVWNTHLEVLSSTRKNQAAEMQIIMSNNRDWSSGQILLGDLNDSAHSSTLGIFTGNGWADAWLLDPASSAGITCCASSGWLDKVTSPTGGKSRRIDYILSQGADLSLESKIALDTFVTVDSGKMVYPSDHAMVLSRLRFRVKLP